MTKQDIIKWYCTSVLPVEGTEELNKFMLDIAVKYDGYKAVFKFPAKADRAFKKYNFTESDIKKMFPWFST